MSPSKFLRRPASFSPSQVVPWPVEESSFDRQFTTKLSALHCRSTCTLPGESYASTPWLMDALETAVATQKVAIESLSNIPIRECDQNPIENYLEDAVELLDACNGLGSRMETVNEYVQALRIVLHRLEGGSDPNASVLKRASVLLNSCEAMERKCTELEKCSSSFRKLGERFSQGTASPLSVTKSSCSEGNNVNTQLQEVLTGSKAIALFACGVLGIALSFKAKRGLPAKGSFPTTSWSSLLHGLHKQVQEKVEKRKKLGCVVLFELRETVNATKNLRDLINLRLTEKKATHHVDINVKIEDLRRSCGKLEESINALQGRVHELYRNLMCIRMALLGAMSYQ
ncbi:hypothetical protein FRX31_022958 [Thalictrum thalictroides]|uniref:Uncharacterized protein n=1 Tax=Thalictrum thalictroides TaxID=46969 RepID=A0A7J6VRG7_THATH|nr:hypothetical protein FRX31_022958 [Thalictrum thalictroides]